MKYYIQIYPNKIRAKRFDIFSSGEWVEDIPIIALDYSKSFEVAACGIEALEFLSQEEESIVVCNPFQSLESWSEDLEFAELYIRWFQQHYLMSNELVLVPPVVTVQPKEYSRSLKEIEKRMIKEIFIHAGAREVRLYTEDRDLTDSELKTKINLKNVVKTINLPKSIITEWVEPVAGGDRTRWRS